MGIEQANQALEAGLQNSAPETPAQAPSTQGQPSGPYDLDTAEKVRWEGKEYTPEQLRKAMMFQSDYTRKSQELAQTRKYYDNLEHDLENVRKDPKLSQEFMKIYPQQFHRYLNQVMPKDWQNNHQENVQDLPKGIQEKLEKIDRFESYIREQEVGKEEANIERITSSLAQKYPEAIEDVVLARAQALVEEGHSLTQESWDKLYKSSHDFMVKKMTDKQNKQFTDQKDANTRIRAAGSGGGTPGQAPRKLSFKEATEAAIQDLTGKR